MLITVHHLEKSRSSRIIWALEELELNYDIEYYKRSPTFIAPPELKKIHPLGKAPILTDRGVAYAESGAILEYLRLEYAKSQPDDIHQYNFWLHYAEGSLMPLFVFKLVLGLVTPKAPFLIRPIAHKITRGIEQSFIEPRLKDHIEYVEQFLGKHEYMAGEFSFADIQMAFPLKVLSTRTELSIPNILNYLQRLEARPAYQRAQRHDID